MNPRSIIVIFLAVVCGTAAAFGVMQMNATSAAAPPPETVPVVTAKQAIMRGHMVTAELLEVNQWPKDLAPKASLRTIDLALERSTLQPIMPGEPIMDAKLAPKEAGRGMAALIPAGMRAYTVQTSRVASHVAGFILPGNRVDVLLTLRSNPNDELGGGSTTTLLQAIEILAVGKRIDAPEENRVESKEAESVTLLVTPEQAAKLDLGQAIGQLTLSLRNAEDLNEAKTEPATVKAIRFQQMLPDIATLTNPPAPSPEPAPQPEVAPPEPEPEAAPAPVVKRRPVVRAATLRGQQWGEVRLGPGRVEE